MNKKQILPSAWMYSNDNGSLMLAYPTMTLSGKYEISDKNHKVLASEDSHAMAEIMIRELLSVVRIIKR